MTTRPWFTTTPYWSQPSAWPQILCSAQAARVLNSEAQVQAAVLPGSARGPCGAHAVPMQCPQPQGVRMFFAHGRLQQIWFLQNLTDLFARISQDGSTYNKSRFFWQIQEGQQRNMLFLPDEISHFWSEICHSLMIHPVSCNQVA